MGKKCCVHGCRSGYTNGDVRPILDYGSQIWSPCRAGDIKLIEALLRKYSKRISGFEHLSYEDRLIDMSLVSLSLRRKWFDLVTFFDYIHLYSNNYNPLMIERNCRSEEMVDGRVIHKCMGTNILKNEFSSRVISLWNMLPVNSY